MRWMAGLFGLPSGAGGLMTSGGATSNLTALKAARDSHGGPGIRADGITSPMAMYASQEAHATIEEAGDMLGLGARAVRLIPTDDHRRMRSDLLEQAVTQDIAAGVQPIAVAATAGTAGTGAIDPLEEVAAVCRRHGLWFHVDAAYGGGAMFAPALRPLLRGIELADSIAFDPHKWLYTPHAGGCLLVRHPAQLGASFGSDATYVYEDRELTRSGSSFGDMGPSWSRSFAALKVWMSLAAHGLDAYARRITHDVELARLSPRPGVRPRGARADGAGRALDRLFPVCAARPAGGEGREAYLNQLNERLLHEIRVQGAPSPAMPTSTAPTACGRAS